MARLAVASDAQIDAIYRESHALWGSGLSRADYRALWSELAGTPWARCHARFLVWLDDQGEILSSLKVYRPKVRLHGRISRATVLGAVFTPAVRRRRGHAARLVEAVVAQAQRDEPTLAMLFSDIGPAYYERLGFRGLPALEQSGQIPRSPAVRVLGEWCLRRMSHQDADAVARAHRASHEGRPLALLRDPGHWEFLRVRSQRFFERLGDLRVGLRCQVAECDGRFAGYLVAVHGYGEWSVREVGAADGSPETMQRVLGLGAARARAEGLGAFYGWLPPEVAARLGDWKLRSRPRNRAVPMILSPRGGPALEGLDDAAAAYLPFQDQF